MNLHQQDGASVRWLQGAILVEHVRGAVLIDAPPGTAALLRETGRAGAVRVIVLTSDRSDRILGLLEVLHEIAHARNDRSVVQLIMPMFLERATHLAGAWERGWSHLVPIEVDMSMPEIEVSASNLPVSVLFVQADTSELTGSTTPAHVPGSGIQLITHDGFSLAFLPNAPPSARLAHLTLQVDLAIIEVGTAPWPTTARPWRRTVDEAAHLAASAHASWIVGDDGRSLADAQAH